MTSFGYFENTDNTAKKQKMGAQRNGAETHTTKVQKYPSFYQ